MIPFLRRSWWMLAFCFICCLIYIPAMQKKSSAVAKLRDTVSQLQLEKDLAQEQKQTLEMQILSQEDPAWIELTLMRQLGVVSEGQKKVYFKQIE